MPPARLPVRISQARDLRVAWFHGRARDGFFVDGPRAVRMVSYGGVVVGHVDNQTVIPKAGRAGPGGIDLWPKEGIMDPNTNRQPERRFSAVGATEEQVDLRDTVPQRINRVGTKVEDEAGTGEQDARGG